MSVFDINLNFACRGLFAACKGDLLGGDNGEVSPSSGTFSSSSLIDGRVNDGPFTSNSCCKWKNGVIFNPFITKFISICQYYCHLKLKYLLYVILKL